MSLGQLDVNKWFHSEERPPRHKNKSVPIGDSGEQVHRSREPIAGMKSSTSAIKSGDKENERKRLDGNQSTSWLE